MTTTSTAFPRNELWFADSFFFLALLIQNDEAHEQAVGMLQDLSARIVTTTWVLTEVADGLAPVRARGGFKQLLAILRSNPRDTIAPADQELFERGVELYNARTDKAWSLTDCISFIVMQDRHMTQALTGDHHFEQAGFVALFK